MVVICVSTIPQQNVCTCFLTLGYEPWLELGPGLSQPEALQKAQAWIRSSLSRSKPGHSRGFQAKPGLHITSSDRNHSTVNRNTLCVYIEWNVRMRSQQKILASPNRRKERRRKSCPHLEQGYRTPERREDQHVVCKYVAPCHLGPVPSPMSQQRKQRRHIHANIHCVNEH